jgi:multiple sugar transport system substrate-binding protein
LKHALRAISWDHPRGVGCLLPCSQQWSDSGRGYSLEWATRSLQEFGQQPIAELAEAFDLIVVDHPHIPQAHAEQLLLPLNEQGFNSKLVTLANESVGLSHHSYAYCGTQYALAIDAAAQVAAYRPDLLGDCPPTDWDHVLDLARDKRVLWPAKPADAISSFITLASNSGYPIDVHDEFIDEAAGLDVLARMHSLADLVPPSCLEQNPIETTELLAMSEQWCYSPLLYGYSNYSRNGFRKNLVAFTDIPEGLNGVAGSCLGGTGIAVSARSRHPDVAIDFAFWLASANVQRGVYFDSGGQPANAAAWDDPLLNQASHDFFAGTRRTLDGAILRPRRTFWPVLQDAAGAWINLALRRQISDSECMRRISKAYRKCISEYGERGVREIL